MQNRTASLLRWVFPVVLAAACTSQQPPVDRVQTNLVDKAIFEGEWWYSSTTVDVDYDEASIFSTASPFAPFEGSMSMDYGIDFNRTGPNAIGEPWYSYPMSRIRWVIDENYLFAFRSFELVQGGNDDGHAPDYRGQPLAVFKIEAHVDVRQEYNATTGEETNVKVENTEDQRWYDRKLMRVDWSQNLITEFAANDAEANELFQTFNRESTPFFIQEGGGEYPDSYRPQYVRIADDASYRFADEWPEDQRDKVHYMSFVTKETWSPAGGCLNSAAACATAAVTLRNTFLRVPPAHEYAVATMSHREFDRFGIIRSHQPTYARGGRDRETLRTYCATDKDCGAGGSCDADRHVCVGGLTADRGETDFLSFFMSRQNLFSDSLTDKACVSDWECDDRNFGTAEARCASADEPAKCASDLRASHGSTCDPAAQRCTVPVRERETRQLAYRLTKHFPPYLVREAFESVAQWNEALMRGQRAAQGRYPIDQVECDEEAEAADPDDEKKGDGVCTHDLATGGSVACQNENPGGFCYCGSPEEQRGVCYRPYLPFESPEEAKARGVPNPYDCFVEGPSDVERPEEYAQYTPEDAYGYKFVGSECLLTLVPNSCDVDAEKPCEELGDLREQFLVHVQHGAVSFGGVAQPLSDPKSGELIVSNAAVAAESIESVGTTATQLFPLLRGETPEDDFFTGENLRGYYTRLGLVEHPVSIAPSGSDGRVGDPSRPPGSQADIFSSLDARMQALAPKMSQLYGHEGRTAIFEDRIKQLRGSPIATRFDSAVAADSARDATALQSTQPVSVADNTALDSVMLERKREQVLSSRYMDDFSAKLYNSQYWEYWAALFKGRSLKESSLRMQQVYFRAVMEHEIGHALGLHHNFAGSLDRNNYHDAYFRIARQLPLPYLGDYDARALGGDEDRDVTGPEAERWARNLREVRRERLAMGAGNVMTSSVMDYDGDLSSFSGMGRYDAAAVMFSYFDRVEAYETADPTKLEPGELPAASVGAPSLEGLTHADRYRRSIWTYYRGGESCVSDAQCPNSAGRETTKLQPITQRCVSNSRVPNNTGSCADGNCICSNFYDDFQAYRDGRAYRANTRPALYAPVNYLFCHDNRVNDLSWCTKNDAGESFQEVVDHYRLSWLQAYPRAYFRNYRRFGPSRGGSQSSVVEAVKIYQHLFFRYNYEGTAFQESEGPLGYTDQLLASADVFNWLGEIIGAPDVGSYTLDTDSHLYRQMGTEPGMSGADLSLSPGQGFYLWSAYQEGLNGFSRLERAGTFLDKLLAIEAIARRDWFLSYTVDERYYINFYDLFPREVVDFFGGLILRNPAAYAPRKAENANGDSLVRYMSLFREGNRGNNAATYPEPAIDGTDSDVLRGAATIQALATFPIFYDTSFEQRLLVFKNGSGEGYKIPETRSDGTPTCGYGDTDCESPDYITYDSDRLHTTYTAVVIQPRGGTEIDEQQLGYQLLLKLRTTQDRVRELRALADPSDGDLAELKQKKLDLERDETFVEYLIELARMFGISTYLY